MDVHDYVKSVRTRDNERAALARTMYGRYVEDMKVKGYTPGPIECFMFCSCTCYVWPVGAIVTVKSAKNGKPFIVKGYDHTSDCVELSNGGKMYATDLAVSDIPEDILEVARQQVAAKMAEKCP